LADALAYMHRSHRIVIAAFAVIVVTGLLMALADVETYSVSALFWIKMGLVALLMANGGFLTFAGRHAGSPDSPWRRRLIAGSAISLVLWLVIVYASSWLMVAA
jgi:amino acid transporter